MAGEVLEHREHAGLGEAGGSRDDVFGDPFRVRGGRPRADGGVARTGGDVGVRGEVDGEAQAAQLFAAGAVGLPREGRVAGRARAHEGRESGGHRSQSLDHTTLLVHAEEERPRAAHPTGECGVDALDLCCGDDVGVEGDDTAEVQAAHQVDGRGRATPLGHDDLPGQVGETHPSGCASGSIELSTIRPPALGQPELLRRGGGNGGRAARGRLLGGRLLGPGLAAGVTRAEGRDERQGRQQGHTAGTTAGRRARRHQPREHPCMVTRPAPPTPLRATTPSRSLVSVPGRTPTTTCA